MTRTPAPWPAPEMGEGPVVRMSSRDLGPGRRALSRSRHLHGFRSDRGKEIREDVEAGAGTRPVVDWATIEIPAPTER